MGLENEKLVNELDQSVELVNEFFELAVGEELLLLQVGQDGGRNMVLSLAVNGVRRLLRMRMV